MGLLTDFANGLSQDGQMTPAGQGLLAAGLGILAHNRGLTSGTAALGMGGLEGLQTYQGAKQQQMHQALQSMQLQGLGINNAIAMQNFKDSQDPTLWGGAPASPSMAGADRGGSAPSVGGGGVGSNMMPPQGFGGGAGAPSSAPPQTGAQLPPAGAGAGTSPMNPLGLPPRVAQAWFRNDRNGYFKDGIAPAYKQADIVAQLRAAGIDPSSALGHQIAQQAIAKANHIAPTSLRPGAPYITGDGALHTTPAAAPTGYQNLQLDDGSWATAPVRGGIDALTHSEAAKGQGRAQGELVQVQGDNGQPMWKPKSEVIAAGGGGPQGGIRNNNPGNVMSPVDGKIQHFLTPKDGIAGMDKNLEAYGSKGINTLRGVISRWAPPNENDTEAYIKDVASRLGLNPEQKINLGDPFVRHALTGAMMIHEHGSARVFGGGAQQNGTTGGGQQRPYAAAPAPGFVANADAAQKASAETMHKSYATLQSSNASANAALEALQKMQRLAHEKSMLSAGVLGTSLTAVNSSAAEYEKQRANVIALLAAQNGTNGSDAGRALTGESVPDYGKPKEAIHDGLQTLINQTRMQQLKGQVLTPAYQAGDSKAYTDLENEFDRNIGPDLMPLLQMSGDAQQAAVKAAVESNPALKLRLEWAYNKGMLK